MTDKTKQLSSPLLRALDDVGLFSQPEWKHPGILLACTPCVREPATLPYRIVLYWQPAFVVHTEIFGPDGKSSFTNGQYFPAAELHLALKAFAERAAKQSEFVKSIYRGLELKQAPQFTMQDLQEARRYANSRNPLVEDNDGPATIPATTSHLPTETDPEPGNG